jgi:hypothetical protein
MQKLVVGYRDNMRVEIEPGEDWLGHRAIQHTARYTELSPTRFKDVWR